jgi:endonuclease YncB( thermonuclease family)
MDLRNTRTIITLLLVALSCLGLLILMGVLVSGAIGFRELRRASISQTSTPARAPTLARTATSILLPSPAPALLPSPASPLITEAPAPSPTLEQPTAGPVPVPTRPLEGFIPGGWCVPWNSPSQKAQVTRVIDGITFEASIENVIHQVRYIGLDLMVVEDDPNKVAAMTQKNRTLVEGKTVLLVKGSPEDGEDPLLRYVIVDGVFVNIELIESGYATAIEAPANNICQKAFIEAQARAVNSERGLWSPAPTPTRTLIPATPTVSPFGEVVVVNVAKRGNGWQEPEEYVEIFNSGTEPVQLKGWSVSDNENHLFWFPGFILGPGQYCRVYTDQYWPKHCGFNYHNPAPIWDNNGDCAYLRDGTGKLVDQFCYE